METPLEYQLTDDEYGLIETVLEDSRQLQEEVNRLLGRIIRRRKLQGNYNLEGRVLKLVGAKAPVDAPRTD